MASRGHHLDPVEGRQIVFCHSCAHEWYQDQHPNLMCPECRGDFTEIVARDSDPRGAIPERSFFTNSHQQRDHDSESDPEEGNIEEHHFHGPGGLFGQRTIHRSPEFLSYGRNSRIRPGNSDDIIRRFTEMIGDIGGPGTVGRSGPETLFNDDPDGPRVTYRSFRGPGFTGGVSSFTITTGPGVARHRAHEGPESPMSVDDPFHRLFGELLALQPHPPPRRENSSPGAGTPGENNSGAGRLPMDFATILNQLLASVVNSGAVHGDAVYSQEALDRIITNLMEANPQSNAPPPATENAIATLPRRKLNEEMLGPELKGECTICIDEVSVGDEVVVLPCKHWFHEECARLWLNQHNSCPVCRAPIDGASAGRAHNDTSDSHNVSRNDDTSSSSRTSGAERRRTYMQQRGEERLDSIRRLATPYDQPHDRHRDPSSPSSYEYSSRGPQRARSSSPSSRGSHHDERGRDNRGSYSGPLDWLRGRFSGR